MTFLPEDDREFLAEKQWAYEELEEPVPGGTSRRALFIPSFPLEGDLYAMIDGRLARQASCELLILIPDGYANTQLDSWYTRPRLMRANGTHPMNTEGSQQLFGRDWQFWSRHLAPNSWRAGIDGLETYFQYVHQAFRSA